MCVVNSAHLPRVTLGFRLTPDTKYKFSVKGSYTLTVRIDAARTFACCCTPPQNARVTARVDAMMIRLG